MIQILYHVFCVHFQGWWIRKKHLWILLKLGRLKPKKHWVINENQVKERQCLKWCKKELIFWSIYPKKCMHIGCLFKRLSFYRYVTKSILDDARRTGHSYSGSLVIKQCLTFGHQTFPIREGHQTMFDGWSSNISCFHGPWSFCLVGFCPFSCLPNHH